MSTTNKVFSAKPRVIDEKTRVTEVYIAAFSAGIAEYLDNGLKPKWHADISSPSTEGRKFAGWFIQDGTYWMRDNGDGSMNMVFVDIVEITNTQIATAAKFVALDFFEQS